MKNRSRLFRIVGAAALVISMLSAFVAPVAAQDDEPTFSQDWLDALVAANGFELLDDNNSIFYPWVANGDDFGLGDSVTSISVQNLEDRATTISIFVGDGAGDFSLATSAYLAPYAAKTFSAAQIGIAAGEGAPVVVTSFNGVPFANYPGLPADLLSLVPTGTLFLAESVVILSNPITADEDGGETSQVLACVVNYHLASQPGLGHPWGYVAVVDHTFDGVAYEAGDWVSFDGVDNVQAALQTALNDVNGADDPEILINPFGGINADGDCLDFVDVVTGVVNNGVAIGGTALQQATAAVPGDNGDDNGDENGDGDDAELEQFMTTHTATSGYNALNGAEVWDFHQWYLPIVQTNCGPGGCWDSMIRVANYAYTNNAVTVRFFPADDGSGSLQTGFQLQALVNGGDTWNINLGDYVPEGWVGTAHILSDGGVFAMVDRYKVGYNMWITNTGSNANFEAAAQVEGANGRYALFAPHVLMDWYGWNTGINVANLVNADNNVSIQYFNMIGNATQVLNQRLAAHGMTYFYDPSIAGQNNSAQDVRTDPNAGVVGSAIIWSDAPVAVAVDATKYPETDPRGGDDVFQATSYNATANVFPWQAVPYVTKGNPIDGSGATSGINIMNPNSVAANANVYWVNPSGFQADNFGTSGVSIPAFANGFVYTLWQHNLPNGFTGAAQVVANVPVAAVSANVNYDVDGDGSAIFNAFNPCGLYRVAGPCSFGDALEPGGQSLTKTYVDPFGNPIPGVSFSIQSTSGAGFQREATTGVDGSAIFTNVPAGTYELVTDDVPFAIVEDESDLVDDFIIFEGVDLALENTLVWDSGFLKTVCVGGESLSEYLGGLFEDPDDLDPDAIEDLEFVIAGMDCAEDDDGEVVAGLAGVNVVVYPVIGEGPLGGVVIGNEPVFEGVTGADGTVGAPLPPGDYLLCVYDEDASNFLGSATTTNGEEVALFIPDRVYISALCAGTLLDIVEWELWGDLFTVEEDETVELTNALWVPFSDLDIFVGTAGALAQAGTDGLNLVEGVEVCLEHAIFGPDRCTVTNADGQAHFADTFVGRYFVYIDYEDEENTYYVYDAWGGDANVAINQSDDEDSFVEFIHSPTNDIGQDGYDSDNDGNGSYDLVVAIDAEA